MTSCCQTPSACSDQQHQSVATLKVALVGNPNCGKTTLFNGLTGAKQRVGNWPGVTVERKSGYSIHAGTTIEVIDLPGIYSLVQPAETALDERISCDYLQSHQADVIINIVDASHLERHLYLTMQLREMGAPIILALNMMDVAKSRQIHIDIPQLSRELGCPVIALEAKKGEGILALKQAIVAYQKPRAVKPLPYPDFIQQSIHELAREIVLPSTVEALDADYIAMRLLEEDVFARCTVSSSTLALIPAYQARIQQTLGEEADILLADTRYRFIANLMQTCLAVGGKVKTSWTSRIDRIVLNRFLGVPIFLAIMYGLFLFSINIGGAFQDFFDLGSQTIFVDGFATCLTHLGAPTWLTVLLANGIGKGINTTMTFIPVIGALFIFLAFLEDSGYMARAAFVIDRFMQMLGLPGKAFVPMIVGFGCNVPAVMAARTLENKRDRILTIMMSPFMSCGARLAIYAVFTAAFFPHGGQNIVFALYLIGILMAILTGFILRQTLLKGDPAPLVMELPTYHVPHLKTILLHAWQRLKSFVFRAGKLIIPICVIIGTLNTLNTDGSMNTGDGDTHSLLSMMGQWVTPLFAPMGIQADNWPATVGLVTGVLAKEVVVGTLNTLYAQLGHFALTNGDGHFHLWTGLQQAWQSIPQNLAQLGDVFSHPVLAKTPTNPVAQSVYGLMYQQFDGRIGAFAYLLFILLYFPCISTTAAMLRELHRGWAIFSILWMTGIAYGAAVIFYQAATFSRHPLAATVWIISMVTAFFMTIAAIRLIYREKVTQTPSLPLGELT